MEIIFVKNDNVLTGLDLIPKKEKDRLFVRGLCEAFKYGDLHISIDRSCLLIIGYDGGKRSFQIQRKDCEDFRIKMKSFWRGESEVRVGLFSVWDTEADDFKRGCNIRFIPLKSKPFNKADNLQTRLIESYVPPSLKIIRRSKKPIDLSVQTELISGGAKFTEFYKPLFKAPRLSPDVQIVLK